MDYLFVNIKIIAALFSLVLLPGLLLIFLLRTRLSELDAYEKVSFGLVSGMAFWIPIAWTSYGLRLNVEIPIHMSLLVTAGLIILNLYKFKFVFPKVSLRHGRGEYFNFYIGNIVIQSILIGYTSQFQTGNSDALTHLAALRNLVTFDTVFSCDHVLGSEVPMLNTYGCNPWYLTLAMIIKLSNVEATIAYSTITGVIYFLSILAIYTLFKAISGNVLISKIGSISFTVVSLIIWIKDNAYTTFNLNSHWVIFPQAIVNFVLFPIMLAAFVRYLLHRDNVFLALSVICLFALTRFHPNWLLWAPIIILGILIFWNAFREKFGIKHSIDYKIVLWFGCIGFISALGFFICKHTFSFDPNLISPLDLWRVSGGNLLYISESIYLYDPFAYLKSRGYFDILTVGLLWYLNSKGSENAKELLLIFIGFLAAIFLIIFNPPVVVTLVKIFGTPIPLYRAFELIWPALSVFTIYSVLAIIRLKSKAYPALSSNSVIVVALLSLVYFGKNASFLLGVYRNQGGYYSTKSSPFSEPFVTLRTLSQGKIAVRTPMATAIASLSNLDPITTEKWRYPTIADFKIREIDNFGLLAFDKPYEELLALINKHKVRYILIKSQDLASINNFNKYPNLIHFKVNAGEDQIWEINEKLE